MRISYTEKVILHCLTKIGNQRTIFSILHLLNGKKTSQTIQDAHLFHLTEFFHLFPRLHRNEFTEIYKRMEKVNIIIEKENLSYKLTNQGQKIINGSSNPLPAYVNGWQYHRYTARFWERLSLLVQVVSQLNKQNQRYIPIQTKKEVHYWLKSLLKQLKWKREDLAKQLFGELSALLGKDESIRPILLVIRLSGYSKIGLTAEQVSDKLRMNEDEYHIHFLNILHYMIQQVEKSRTEFPILQQLILDDDHSFSLLTKSTSKTYQLLQQGLSIDEIAAYRNLKKGTIEDHIVEIALNIQDFTIDKYVSQFNQQQIERASKNVSTKQLKYIRQSVPGANYFEIRLVLAKNGIR